MEKNEWKDGKKMKLDAAAAAKWEASLKEAEYMGEDDHIIEHTKGDLWEFMSQTRGNFFFTNEKFMLAETRKRKDRET